LLDSLLQEIKHLQTKWLASGGLTCARKRRIPRLRDERREEKSEEVSGPWSLTVPTDQTPDLFQDQKT